MQSGNNPFDQPSHALEPEVSETERLQAETQQSLDNALRSIVGTDQLASDTLAEFNGQTEKLEQARNGVAQIQHDSKVADRSLRSINWFFGSWVNYFTPAPVKPKTPEMTRRNTVPEAVAISDSTTDMLSGMRAEARAEAPATTAKAKPTVADNMKKEQQRLAELSVHLASVRRKAEALHTAIQEEKPLLEELSKQTKDATIAIKNLNRKM